MDKGILLIALDGWGSGFYYHLSYNMALSIKLRSPDIKIALLTDDKWLSHLSARQKSVFDSIIEIDDKHYLEEFKINPFLLKTQIYDFSPFQETLYLDSDGLLVGDVNKLLEELSVIDFQIHEVRRYRKDQLHESGMIWTKPNEKEPNLFPEQWQAYELQDDSIYPEYNSSFIWFKRTTANKTYFEKVKENYFDRRVKWKDMGASYPDEMAWNITSAQMNHMGKENYKPCFFEWENTNKDFDSVLQHYFMMLAGGYQISRLITYYDNIVKSNRANFGDSQPFKFEINKKIFFRK